MLKGSLKNKSEAIVQSIEGCSISPEQAKRLVIVRSHLDFINNTIQTLDASIDELVKPYESHIAILRTSPGIERQTAVTIISEVGTDVSDFDSARRLCAWAGLAPSNNRSAGKKKSDHISRAGVYLKPALVQAAHAAVKDKKSPYYKNKYERISKRRGKKRAIIAIARMILTAAYNMLKTGEAWNPTDLFKVDMPPVLLEKQKQKAIKSAIKLLVSQGIIEAAPALAV